MDFLHKIFLAAQDLYIRFNSYISPSMIHNFEKHDVLKKFLFYKEIEGVKGDYLEFGVYEGTSLKGAATYWRKIGKTPMKFYGFDSFEGMKPEKGDEHPFYTSFDFSTKFSVIRNRFKEFPEVKLVKGFFQETLKKGAKAHGISKAAIVMMDCDLYSSSKEAFNFLKPIIGKGTVLILDDYFNYAGDKKKGVRAAFEEFTKTQKITYEEITRYGVGGIVFVITS
ncbi:TylF/MycF family methyltransferase [Candidatus Pacearchaeota archaeon]|nr:TylF/MycF family methyltransferase [Candidatus Pacearchaeota archaeon]